MLSLFQIVPKHIIHDIIKYSVYQCADNKRSLLRLYKAILHTCHQWRTALITFCFESCEIVMYTKTHSIIVYKNWPFPDIETYFPTYEHVKKVTFYVSGWVNMMDGTGLDFLKDILDDNVVFTNANRINIKNCCLETDVKIETEAIPEAIHNVLLFFNAIKALVPAAVTSRIEIWSSSLWMNSPQLNDALDSLLLSYIGDTHYTSISSTDSPTSTIQIAIQTSFFPGLTHFTYQLTQKQSWGFECIRKHSSCLQYLSLSYSSSSDMLKILYDVNGDPVVYSSLESFRIDEPKVTFIGFESSDSHESPTIAPYESVHFPRLKSLVVYEPCPISLDTLFRGNSSRLEKLEIRVSMDHVNNQRWLAAIERNRLTSLKRLHIGVVFAYLQMEEEHVLTYEGFVRQFAEKTCTDSREMISMELVNISNSSVLYNEYHIKPVYYHLRVLCLQKMALSFDQIMHTCISLPQLQRLSCVVNARETDDKHTHWVSLVDRLVGLHFSINTSLRYLQTSNHRNTSMRYLFNSVHCLAVLCPRLRYIKYYAFDDTPIRRMFRRTRRKMAFKKYSDRLKTLQCVFN